MGIFQPLVDWLAQFLWCFILRALCYLIKLFNEYFASWILELLDALPDVDLESYIPEIPEAITSGLWFAQQWFPLVEFLSLSASMVTAWLLILPARWALGFLFK